MTPPTQTRSRRKQATATGAAARQLLMTPTTAAVALWSAAKALLGDFEAWEPESLWLELERRGLDLPAENRVKLQAALALALVPSFYWDGVAFEKTALAFDHVVTNPDALEEATVAQLAWAVREAASILSRQGRPSHEFAHEPAAYTAVVLHREGFLEAPEALGFAQAQLDRLNRGDTALRRQVQASWQALDKPTLGAHAFAETQVDVQLARLAAVELHVRERESRLAADLAMLA